MSDRLTTLIAAVDAADSATLLYEKVEELAAARLEGAIPTLIAALSYNNPGAAVAAVEGLIQLGTPAVPLLIDQLDRHNYTARSWAIRALAGIGDPRGLETLLDAAATDMVASVRRAAARGLGIIQWHWFPDALLPMAQAQALTTLLSVAQTDEEWGVRYAAAVGLQALALALDAQSPPYSQIETQLQQMGHHDPSDTVRARVWMAQQQLQTQPHTRLEPPSPLSEQDWHTIGTHLQARQSELQSGFPGV